MQKAWLQRDHKKDACFQYDSWNQEAEHHLLRPPLGRWGRGDSNFLPSCACLRVTVKALTVLILGLQINFREQVNLQTWHLQIMKTDCVWWEGEGTHLNPKFLTSFKFGFLNIYGFYNRAFSIIQYERAKNSSFSSGIRVNMPKLSFPRSHLLFNSQNARATRLWNPLSPTCSLLGNMEVGTALCLESLRTVMCKIWLFLIKGVVLADVYTKFLSSVLLAKRIRRPPRPPPQILWEVSWGCVCTNLFCQVQSSEGTHTQPAGI